MKRTFGLMILIALLSLNALADIASPEKPKPVKSQMAIYLDPETKETKLVISREMINQLANAEGSKSDSVSRNLSFGQTQTLVSGLFLSLAIVFGGVWFARSKNHGKGSRIAMGIGVLAMLGISFSIAFANARAPLYSKISEKIFSKGMQTEKSAYGEITIEIEEEGNSNLIELRVPQEKKSK